ncbi:hypothetical protein [Heyndrickxia acidicola]|uniref:Uncharacterized protein n=1 Tax=Heyndrickxia acidicola TaxID=209389 RepID=A0ABU6MQ87_9BACI|nr:hypothetical protein [Heyndrickxia acidicola]MED1206106.1 hypothetical protein [Heyndrickxia acidicola]
MKLKIISVLVINRLEQTKTVYEQECTLGEIQVLSTLFSTKGVSMSNLFGENVKRFLLLSQGYETVKGNLVYKVRFDLSKPLN